MKTLLILLVLLQPSHLFAQGSDYVGSASWLPDWPLRTVQTSDIQNVELDSGRNILFFTVSGEKFYYSPDRAAQGISAAEALAELRQVKEVTLSVHPPEEPTPHRCFLWFRYKSLHP